MPNSHLGEKAMMRYSRFLLGLPDALVATSAKGAEEKASHVYNWSDYIADDTVY